VTSTECDAVAVRSGVRVLCDSVSRAAENCGEEGTVADCTEKCHAVTRRSKKSSENVPLPGVSAGESLVDLLTLRGFRLHAGAGTERIYERLDKDGVGFFAFVTADSPPWLIVGALLEVDIQPDGIVGPLLVAQSLHEDFGLVKAMLRPELGSFALQVPLPLLAPNLMEPYLGRALEQIEAAARLTLAAVQDAKPTPHEKAAKTRAVAKARTAAARASGATPAESRSHAELTTYRLKITLRGSKPPIWRRILVPSSTMLPELHRIFQVAMGWTDSHLHAFRVGDIQYGTADREFGSGMRGERGVRLLDIAPAPRSRFVYWYDFGDDWTHDVLVEEVTPVDQTVKLPTCVGGKRACPPEDVGGIYGYVDFLGAYQDARHGEHEQMREWAGPEFDPESFDSTETAHELERLRA